MTPMTQSSSQMFVYTENKAEFRGLSVGISALGHLQRYTDLSGRHLVCWVGLQLQGPRQLLAVYCPETLFPTSIYSFQRALVSCRSSRTAAHPRQDLRGPWRLHGVLVVTQCSRADLSFNLQVICFSYWHLSFPIYLCKVLILLGR